VTCSHAFIPTDHASQYFRWLDKLRLLKQCGRVIGPREVGKSKSSEHYRNENQKRISYVDAWSNSSPKKLFSEILKDIHHAASTGKQQDLRSRLAGCLKPFGIELLLIDNADNLQKEALIDLKQLHERSGVPVILIGGTDLDGNLENFDLLTSFPSLFKFDKLDKKDFKKTLKTIEFDVLALPQASNLWEGILFEILVIKTEARIGILIDVLKEAVLCSLEKGHGKIEEAILYNVINCQGVKYSPPAAQETEPDDGAETDTFDESSRRESGACHPFPEKFRSQ